MYIGQKKSLLVLPLFFFFLSDLDQMQSNSHRRQQSDDKAFSRFNSC